MTPHRRSSITLLASLASLWALPAPAQRQVEITLTAAPKRLALVPGVVTQAFTYNGRFPGPTLEFREGDRVTVHFRNNLPEPTSDQELRDIAAYLKRGVKPVSNRVADSEGPPDFWASAYTPDTIGPYPLAPFPTANERSAQ